MCMDEVWPGHDLHHEENVFGDDKGTTQEGTETATEAETGEIRRGRVSGGSASQLSIGSR